MDESCHNFTDTASAKLETLLVVSINTLKRDTRKCGTDEVLQIMSEYIDNKINRKFFERILETLTQKQKGKANCFENRTCVSVTKEDHPNKTKTNVKDNLKEDFINRWIREKEVFFFELKQVKNQL